jgi:hypothetical protein
MPAAGGQFSAAVKSAATANADEESELGRAEFSER